MVRKGKRAQGGSCGSARRRREVGRVIAIAITSAVLSAAQLGAPHAARAAEEGRAAAEEIPMKTVERAYTSPIGYTP
jgi:hypothetical protein